jgi:hypothetical protein
MKLDRVIDRWEHAWSQKQAEVFSEVCSSEVHYEDPLTLEPLERSPTRAWSAPGSA